LFTTDEDHFTPIQETPIYGYVIILMELLKATNIAFP